MWSEELGRTQKRHIQAGSTLDDSKDSSKSREVISTASNETTSSNGHGSGHPAPNFSTTSSRSSTTEEVPKSRTLRAAARCNRPAMWDAERSTGQLVGNGELTQTLLEAAQEPAGGVADNLATSGNLKSDAGEETTASSKMRPLQLSGHRTPLDDGYRSEPPPLASHRSEQNQIVRDHSPGIWSLRAADTSSSPESARLRDHMVADENEVPLGMSDTDWGAMESRNAAARRRNRGEGEDEEMYAVLRGFFNQYVAMSCLQLVSVFAIITVDVGTLGGLLQISPRGELWFAQLDFFTLVMFTIEVLVNIWTYGKRFFHSGIHKFDLLAVTLSDVFYFATYCTDIFGTKSSVEREEVTVDILRSLLRIVRLAVVVVRLNDALHGPMENLHTRMRAVHRANSKLGF